MTLTKISYWAKEMTVKNTNTLTTLRAISLDVHRGFTLKFNPNDRTWDAAWQDNPMIEFNSHIEAIKYLIYQSYGFVRIENRPEELTEGLPF